MSDHRPDAARPAQALEVAEQRGWTLTVLDLDAEYKQHLAEGELWLPYCVECARFLPAWISRCADHWDAAIRMERVTGPMTLWSWVEYRHDYALPVGVKAPYVVAAVELGNGPRVNGFVLAPAADFEGLHRGTVMQVDTGQTKSLGTLVLEITDEGVAA